MIEAKEALASNDKFVLFGENHGDAARERSSFIKLIPSMRTHGVSVIGTEFPPSMNGLFRSLQKKIAKGKLSLEQVRHRLYKGLVHHGFEAPELLASPKLAELLRSATRHGIKVVGIDPTGDNPAYMRQINSPKELDATDCFGLDGESARNAARYVTGKPHARMAILYGLGHGKIEGKAGVDRPAILSEELTKYGSTKVVSLVPSYLPQGVVTKNYRILNTELSPDALKGKTLSDFDDGQPTEDKAAIKRMMKALDHASKEDQKKFRDWRPRDMKL